MGSMQQVMPLLLAFILLLNGSSTAVEHFSVVDFLKDVKHLHGIDSLLIVHNWNITEIDTLFIQPYESESEASNGEMNFVKNIMDELMVPVIQMNERSPLMYLKKTFSTSFLSLVYIDGSLEDHRGLLKHLLANLRQMTSSKFLFLVNEKAVDHELLKKIFEWCWKNKVINTVALFADYQHSETFYSYTHFPEFEIEKKTIYADVKDRKEIYPYRLGNLRGYKLPYILGGSDPRILIYFKPNGEKVIGGFVGHFLSAFAYKYNCKLVEPLPANSNAFAPAQQLIAAVRNGTVEISAAITFPEIPFIGYTYPYEQLNWCIMIPVESDIPGYEFYVIVFELSAFLITLGLLVVISMVLSAALCLQGHKPDLLDLIMHENCLRGVLGQSFTEIANPSTIVRFIYMQICFLGILLTTSYNSYFATYVTSAPKEPQLQTFDDIMNSGMKLFAWAPEYKELIGRVKEYTKYASMFYQEPNYQEYLRMRDSFDTTYGYVVPNTKWTIVNEQQKIFTSPIFRLSDDLCFFNNIPMCFPVPDNSIFVGAIEQLILETAQSGLTYYWRQNGFFESITAGRMTFADLSTKKVFTAMNVEDLVYIWYGYALMVSLVTFIFCSEYGFYHRAKISQYLCGCKLYKGNSKTDGK